eukprot:CAMPEP_0172663066 /NCGR_PEP_ID=MMETSP1074-20121228/5695_1 /TAXON_ID=2916 /ORGANISM="Ceratium fusus, Strain PA161109" /LENGTH=32 /DNA_ID= /DNA_START= /DNA_END= /DNA_ORIENTATION=
METQRSSAANVAPRRHQAALQLPECRASSSAF